LKKPVKGSITGGEEGILSDLENGSAALPRKAKRSRS
jgi:hypothetical protein